MAVCLRCTLLIIIYLSSAVLECYTAGLNYAGNKALSRDSKTNQVFADTSAHADGIDDIMSKRRKRRTKRNELPVNGAGVDTIQAKYDTKHTKNRTQFYNNNMQKVMQLFQGKMNMRAQREGKGPISGYKPHSNNGLHNNINSNYGHQIRTANEKHKFNIFMNANDAVPKGPTKGDRDNVKFNGERFHNFNDHVAAPKPSRSSLWPKPQFHLKYSRKFQLRNSALKFVIKPESSDILIFNVKRAWVSIFGNEEGLSEALDKDNIALTTENPRSLPAKDLKSISLTVNKHYTKYPTLDSNEKYDLSVQSGGIYVTGEEVWGVIKGLQTLSQLAYSDIEGRVWINQTTIRDWPRFPHRGIMLDTARHYITVSTIITNLEAMAMNKMNVFHWHIVDDESFPFASRTFPNLTKHGAYSVNKVYTHEMIARVIEEARLRGIRVIPEFDTPGHTLSWGYAMEGLVTPCFNPRTGKPNGAFGPLNPVRNATYRFLEKLLAEIVQVFPEQYVHIGGDEVPLECWRSNPEIKQFMNDNGIIRISKVHNLYYSRYTNIIGNLKYEDMKVTPIVWQETFDNYLPLSGDTVVQIWKNDVVHVDLVNNAGFRSIFSSCWYLDRVQYGITWTHYYLCKDGGPSVDSFARHRFVNESSLLGGEACMWTEYVGESEVINRIWPLASATAERLWSSADTVDISEAGPRIEEQRCRMIRRGLKVGVLSGPGFCEDDDMGHQYAPGPPAWDDRLAQPFRVTDQDAHSVITPHDLDLRYCLTLIIFIVGVLWICHRSGITVRSETLMNRILSVFRTALRLPFTCIIIWVKKTESFASENLRSLIGRRHSLLKTLSMIGVFFCVWSLWCVHFMFWKGKSISLSKRLAQT